MGKQLLFRMNIDDEILLSSIIKNHFNVEFLDILPNDDKIIKLENLSICSSKCFIWNKEFEYSPRTIKKGNTFVIDAIDAPIIEYSPYRRIHSDLNTSRIYWSADKSFRYDYLKFNNWYNKVCQIIKTNSASVIKLGRNIYCWKGYLCEKDNKKIWIRKGNLLCLNVGTTCVNNCASCIKNECFQIMPSQTDALFERIITELESDKSPDVLLGGFSEPLSSETIKLVCRIINHIENRNIFIITNGLSYAENISRYRSKIKSIFVLNYSDEPYDYVNMTLSKFGVNAKKIQTQFIETATSLGLKIVILNSTRQEALSKLCGI